MRTYLSSKLMRTVAVGSRHGLVLPPQRATLSQSDVQGITHMGIPSNVISPWQSAAGGVGRTKRIAELAAIGEGIERAAAATVAILTRPRQAIGIEERIDADEFCLFSSQQRDSRGFPFGNVYTDDCPYMQVFSVQDNMAIWAPQPFVTLQDDHATGVPTSSGLAAGPTAEHALLRGIQELIERDALMTTWLHGLPGKRVKNNIQHDTEVRQLDGEVFTYDITPAYSPFSVALVAGGIKKRGAWRYSLGVACRESWDDAAEKAYLEWNQGVLFAGIYGTYALRSFDEHAMYYTLHPEEWEGLRLFTKKETVHPTKKRRVFSADADALAAARRALKRHGIRMYYRDITTVDAMQVGVRVVKALSPDLALIFAHQEWPFLHKVDLLLERNYPGQNNESVFPYLMPHPLG
jgi:ribosomal protein S12 methylthiotransferase accessory factor